MSRRDNIALITELSEIEGVFTTAQAARMGIPRDALHDAVVRGRLERVVRGAYRLVGSGASHEDELVAIWKLTAPERYTHERIRPSEWDGIVVGGSTAASLLGIGDLWLSPYRLYYGERRVSTRSPFVSIARRKVLWEDVTYAHGVLVTRPERTVFDLVVDNEDLSLVADVLRDAAYADRGFDFERLSMFLRGRYSRGDAERIYRGLLADADVEPMGVDA